MGHAVTVVGAFFSHQKNQTAFWAESALANVVGNEELPGLDVTTGKSRRKPKQLGFKARMAS